MGFKVGIPCMKCSLSPSQQVNRKTGKAAKTCGVSSAWNEMNDDRMGRDTTIDRTLTDKNVWMDGDTSDNVPKMVQDEVSRINEERRENGLRALRKDAVSVVEIVEKPPIEYMQNLSYEEKKTFLSDSHDVMKGLIHEWNPHWIMIESVQHHDEFGGLSAHNHSLVLLTSEDKNGIATMNAKGEFNLKFFNHINTRYPNMMREKGYDIEDCKTFDRLSEEEKEQRRLHPEEHGVDAYKYKQKKQEEMSQKLSELQAEAETMSDDLDRMKAEERSVSEDLAQKKEELINLTGAPSLEAYETILHENAMLKEEISLKERIIEKLQNERDRFKEASEKWRGRFSDIARKAGAVLMGILGYDVRQEIGIKEYPSKEVSAGLEKMTGSVEEKNARQYRVLPDNAEKGKFRVAYRNEDGSMETVKGGFDTRDLADRFRRNIAGAAQEIGKTFEDEIKRGASIS